MYCSDYVLDIQQWDTQTWNTRFIFFTFLVKARKTSEFGRFDVEDNGNNENNEDHQDKPNKTMFFFQHTYVNPAQRDGYGMRTTVT